MHYSQNFYLIVSGLRKTYYLIKYNQFKIDMKVILLFISILAMYAVLNVVLADSIISFSTTVLIRGL